MNGGFYPGSISPSVSNSGSSFVTPPGTPRGAKKLRPEPLRARRWNIAQLRPEIRSELISPRQSLFATRRNSSIPRSFGTRPYFSFPETRTNALLNNTIATTIGNQTIFYPNETPKPPEKHRNTPILSSGNRPRYRYPKPFATRRSHSLLSSGTRPAYGCISLSATRRNSPKTAERHIRKPGEYIAFRNLAPLAATMRYSDTALNFHDVGIITAMRTWFRKHNCAEKKGKGYPL